MTTEIQNRPEQPQQRSAPSPLSKGEVVNELSACLALVRPVGMGDDAATEWLTVATSEVCDFAQSRPGLFKAACKSVRRECTHHGQIVPGILKRQLYDWERDLGRDSLPAPREQERLAAPETRTLIENAAANLRR